MKLVRLFERDAARFGVYSVGRKMTKISGSRRSSEDKTANDEHRNGRAEASARLGRLPEAKRSCVKVAENLTRKTVALLPPPVISTRARG